MTDLIDFFSPDELQIVTDASLWSKEGGQKVGSGPPGVTITHLPTGIKVHVECDRMQFRNRNIALHAIMGAITSPDFRGIR